VKKYWFSVENLNFNKDHLNESCHWTIGSMFPGFNKWVRLFRFLYLNFSWYLGYCVSGSLIMLLKKREFLENWYKAVSNFSFVKSPSVMVFFNFISSLSFGKKVGYSIKKWNFSDEINYFKPFLSFLGIFDHLFSFSLRSAEIFSLLLKDVSKATVPSPAVDPSLPRNKWSIWLKN